MATRNDNERWWSFDRYAHRTVRGRGTPDEATAFFNNAPMFANKGGWMHEVTVPSHLRVYDMGFDDSMRLDEMLKTALTESSLRRDLH